jgi:hypothetical protein
MMIDGPIPPGITQRNEERLRRSWVRSYAGELLDTAQNRALLPMEVEFLRLAMEENGTLAPRI